MIAEQNHNDDEILEAVLAEFSNLAAIPRPSGHEEKVSAFLKDRLTKRGFDVTRDDACNIIADKAAAPGFENAPRTILQAHMDMVAVAEEGKDFDPLTDSVKILRDGEFLRADGTSLGADDGIGVAVGIYALTHFKEHGPLRLIITTDEERGMTGAKHLDSRYVADAKYLINCDSENFEELIIGCAGGVDITFTRKADWLLPKKNLPREITVAGLKGGHSGERIGDGRGNALHILSAALLSIKAVCDIEIGSIKGGRAPNVIPDNARAVIVGDVKDATLRYIADAMQERYRGIHGDADPGITVSVNPAKMPEYVFGQEAANDILRLLYLLPKGVFGMSRAVPNLVESSGNLGVARTEDKEVTVKYFPRSSNEKMLEEFAVVAKNIADATNFAADCREPSPAWRENKNSRLAAVMTEIFAAQNGKFPKVTAIHAGLECGYFFRKNKDLDIVSVGVTTQDIHSPKERLLLSSVAPNVRLLEATLAKIARM